MRSRYIELEASERSRDCDLVTSKFGSACDGVRVRGCRRAYIQGADFQVRLASQLPASTQRDVTQFRAERTFEDSFHTSIQFG